MSAAIKFTPSKPRMIVRSSRVDHPPVSGVPVAGATALPLAMHRNLPKSSSRTSRVESIDVNTQVDGLRRANTVPDLPDDAMHTNRVNLACLDDLKPTVAVILVITGSGQGCPNPRVDIAIVGKQPFERCVVEISAVVNTSLLAWGTAEDFWSPCVAPFISLVISDVDGRVLTDGYRNG